MTQRTECSQAFFASKTSICFHGEDVNVISFMALRKERPYLRRFAPKTHQCSTVLFQTNRRTRKENADGNSCTPSSKASISLRRISQNITSFSQFLQISPVPFFFGLTENCVKQVHSFTYDLKWLSSLHRVNVKGKGSPYNRPLRPRG